MRFFLVFLTLLFPALAQEKKQIPQIPERSLPTKTIAILRDQPSPYFEKIITGFLTYLKPLARDQYQLEVISVTPKNSSVPEIKNALIQTFDNPKIDAIFTAGITASHIALKLDPAQRTKPVIAGAIEFSDLENTLVAQDGSSKIPNYSFVLVPNRLRSDFTTLSSLAKTKIIHVLLEQQVIDTLAAELTKNVDAFEAANDLDVRIVPLSPKNLSLPNLPVYLASRFEKRRQRFEKYSRTLQKTCSLDASLDFHDIIVWSPINPRRRYGPTESPRKANPHHVKSRLQVKFFPLHQRAHRGPFRQATSHV